MTDEEIAEFIERSRTATMATVLPDGRPHLVAMWYAVVDGEIWFETKAKSQKAVNLRRDPTITVMIEDGQSYDTLRGVSIDGKAEIVDDPETILRVGISVWERYTGPYTEEMRPFVDQMMNNRICVRVVPSRLRSWDHRKLGMPRDAHRRQHGRVPLMPQERPKQLDSPLLPKIFKYAGKAHVWVYRRTGGKVGGKWRIGAGFRKPVPTLLLEHRGRKSGKVFVTPLLYMFDGADVVIVASQGGRPDDPQWYRNLMANPDTFVEIGADRRAVHAVKAGPDERARLWPKLVELYADFDNYQSWTDREIPVVVLKPR